jgi:hypothetical protein
MYLLTFGEPFEGTFMSHPMNHMESPSGLFGLLEEEMFFLMPSIR